MTVLGRLVFIFFVAALAVQGRKLRSRRLAPLAQLAGEYDFPHQVSIQRDGRHHCGGALISRQHVLTAAHCVRDTILSPEPSFVKGQRLLVEVGSRRIGSGTRYAVKRISQIRTYVGQNPAEYAPFVPNDIAVITLRTPVTESARVKTIGLPAPSSELPVGSPVTISGFGSAYVNGPSSNVLLTSPMYVVSQQECNNYYIAAHSRTIIGSHICAKFQPGHGTCQGDSGGPLIQGNTVVGVVSGGSGQCDQGYPDAYTKVSHFIPYLQYEMNYNSETPETAASPSLAVNIEEAPEQTPWQYPTQENIQFMDPNTGELLPPGSVVVLVDPNTGLPIIPETSEFPHIPLYPLYIDPASGLIINQ